jgi:hypothetical protein
MNTSANTFTPKLNTNVSEFIPQTNAGNFNTSSDFVLSSQSTSFQPPYGNTQYGNGYNPAP